MYAQENESDILDIAESVIDWWHLNTLAKIYCSNISLKYGNY